MEQGNTTTTTATATTTANGGGGLPSWHEKHDLIQGCASVLDAVVHEVGADKGAVQALRALISTNASEATEAREVCRYLWEWMDRASVDAGLVALAHKAICTAQRGTLAKATKDTLRLLKAEPVNGSWAAATACQMMADDQGTTLPMLRELLPKLLVAASEDMDTHAAIEMLAAAGCVASEQFEAPTVVNTEVAVGRLLRDAGRATVSEIRVGLQTFGVEMTAAEIQNALRQLISAGQVRKQENKGSRGGRWVYVAAGWTAADWSRFAGAPKGKAARVH